MRGRILFVIDSLAPGGAERSLVELLPALKSAGLNPTIVCLKSVKEGFEDEARSRGAEVGILSKSGRIGRTLELRGLIRVFRPSLIHTTLFESDISGRLAAIGTGIPVSTSLVNTSYDRTRLDDPHVSRSKLEVVRLVDSWTARHLTARFHAISYAVRDAAARDLGIDPVRVAVIPRGRNLAQFSRPDRDQRNRIRRQLSLTEDSEVLINVGRQEYQKGQRYLLEAVHSLAQSMPNLRLLIAGREGNASADLRRLCSQLALENRVSFLGHRPDIGDLLAASDVFVFPSVYEGLGGAVIEAMAAGLPIIASDLPALREVPTTGGARFVPPRSPSAMAEAIREIIGDEKTRRAMGEENIRRSRAFDIEGVSARMVDFLVGTSAVHQ